MGKATEKWITELQKVMGIIDGLDIDERDRVTLRRSCASSLVEAEDRLAFDYEHRSAGEKWTQNDIALLETTLKKAPACLSWNEEQMMLTSLTQRLGRPTKTVKKKAIELGYGCKVDYWINRIDKKD